jgi:putative transposase
MNPRRCDDLDYIQFLIATQTRYTCTEAARCQPEGETVPAHDSLNRLLNEVPPDTEALWQEAQDLVNRESGHLVLDDSTLDKLYAKKMELVTRHWSGKHHRVVQGINLLSLVWTDGNSVVPCDFRVYHKVADEQTKNDPFRTLLSVAKERGFQPGYVLFDRWYSGLKNLKTIRGYGWHWLTRLKSNRQVNPDDTGNVPISSLEISPEGRIVHLKGYGFIRVFRTAAPNGDAEHWATDDLEMTETDRQELELQGWQIETYHRGIKQCCGIERAQVRKADAQQRHLLLALRAFLRLEVHRVKTQQSWYDAKLSIIRDAIRSYLSNPSFLLQPTA